jgi:hypothetical protein
VKVSQGDGLVLIEHGLRRALPSRYLRCAMRWDRLGTSVGTAHDGAREACLPWSILMVVREPRPTNLRFENRFQIARLQV